MKTILSLLLALLLPTLAVANHHESDPSAAKTDAYPLKTCVVSGEELGGMGEPYVLMYKEAGKPDREVRFCCQMCVGRFNSNPAKFLAKLDAAVAGQAAAHDEHAEGEAKACCAEGSCEKCATEPATKA